MLTQHDFEEIQAAVEDEKSISAELADNLFEAYKTAARLVNKHHRRITPCVVCGFDPLGREDFDPEELSRTWEYGIVLDPNANWEDYPENVNTFLERDRAQELAARNDDFILLRREAAGEWKLA